MKLNSPVLMHKLSTWVKANKEINRTLHNLLFRIKIFDFKK
jgi:hypothetical protein